MTTTAVRPIRVSLALQGGGSFGAFTWGVLDRLLEEDALELDVASGASAGAINAVLLASGLAEPTRGFPPTLLAIAPTSGGQKLTSRAPRGGRS